MTIQIYWILARDWEYSLHSKKNGWNCTSIDPDPICIKHIHNNLKLEAILQILWLKPHKKFDIVTLNKVLEHVNDPIKMLRKLNWVKIKELSI